MTEITHDPSLDLAIELDHSVPKALANSAQEKAFNSGVLKTFHLHRNPQDQYYPLHTESLSKSPKPLDGVYAFVIVENENAQLELRAGRCSHYFAAHRARFVRAAGDLHFSEGKLKKFTDQSGTYHVQDTDPLAKQRKGSAQAAMRAVGLPMDKFEPYRSPGALIFSKALQTRTTPENVTRLEPSRSKIRTP